MSEALAAVFPETTLQTCIVHLIRQSLDFATWKERKPLATALRTIYGAPSAEAAGAALTHEIPDTPEAKRFYANKPQVSEAVGRATRSMWPAAGCRRPATHRRTETLLSVSSA